MTTDRCSCGECGGVALLPAGAVVRFRSKPARVEAWAPQDHWNVPCIDSEGAVSVCRDLLDDGPAYTLDDADRAVDRLADLVAAAADASERDRLQRDLDAWSDLRSFVRAGFEMQHLNP